MRCLLRRALADRVCLRVVMDGVLLGSLSLTTGGGAGKLGGGFFLGRPTLRGLATGVGLILAVRVVRFVLAESALDSESELLPVSSM